MWAPAALAEPRQVARTYAGTQDDGEKKAMMTLNWMLDEVTDTETDLGLGILSYILTGTPGRAAAPCADRPGPGARFRSARA